MRVIFTTWAWPSHLYALTPLAWACRAAGHEVRFVSEPALAGQIAGAGLPGVVVGHDVDTAGMVRDYLRPRTEEKGPPRALRMLMAHADAMAADLIAFARDWRADLVVYDPTNLAGALAAGAVGVPGVRHLFGTDLMARAASALPELLEPLMRRHGVPRLEPLGTVTIDPVPAAVQLQSSARRWFTRWVPFCGETAGSALPPPPGHPPRVVVTWGHTLAKVDRHLFLAGEVARALAGLDAEILVAVSSAQRDLVGPVPDNATVLVDAPLDRVVPGCDLVVSHGGAGTILTSLAYGVPLVLVPRLPDHTGHAGRVAEAGAGVVVSARPLDVEALRVHVARMLAGSAERAAAQKLRDEMARAATPADTVRKLETLLDDQAR